MKRAGLFSLATGVLLLGATCTQSGPSTSNNGSGGANSGGTKGSGGATDSGGSNGSSSGGTTGSGGEKASSGGSTGTGGQNTSSGGTTGSGGDKTSSGGNTGSGGMMAATGGVMAATGGTGTGGKGTGGVGSGTGGAAGGMSGTLNAADVVPDLVGFYWEGTCVGTMDPGSRNCPMFDKGATCPTGASYDQQGVIRDKVFNVKGTKDQKYTVTVDVRGVVGGRCYQKGMRASSAAASDTGVNNWWYIGGEQYNNSWWNTYELHVSPATGDASNDVYYFNASDNAGGSYCEKEATYLIQYTASFKVVGGGTMTFRLHDSNCKAQQNCGSVADPNAACSPRKVDLTGVSPQPPASFMQPPTTVLSKTYYPQWIWITTKSVTTSP